MLTTLQIAAFKIHRYCFWYIPGFVLEWKPNYENIWLRKDALPWLTWAVFTLDALCIAFGDFYVIYTHFCIAPRKFLRPTHIFIFLSGGCFVLIVFTIAMILTTHKEKLVMGLNALFSVEAMLIKRKISLFPK